MSHFSFTRTTNDDCALLLKNKESTGPFDWATDNTITENKESCFQGSAPFSHNPYRSIPSNVVDFESELRGQTRDNSKCATHKFNPNMAPKINFKWNECTDNKLVPEYTKLNKSCNVLSGITINRFQPLYEDPQEFTKIHNNNYIGSNTRLLIKDAFKKANA